MSGVLWRIARWFLFRLDAETAHHATLTLIRSLRLLGPTPLRWISGGTLRASPKRSEAPTHIVFGMGFRSRVGLAAGFDKNAEILRALPALGYGFAEIGTVTPQPQPGNPRPRLFRDIEHEAVFNRMGFNGLGATIISQRLKVIQPSLPADFRVGVNVGKNKETPLEDAADDYVKATRPFAGLADYVVMNVSSPNTLGLRKLQNPVDLQKIVSEVQNLVSGWKKRPPLLLKLSPELRGTALSDLLQAVEGWGAIDGWVLTNTLAGARPGDPHEGGWSGRPLQEISRRSLVEARAATKLPIISVGGIDSPGGASARIDLGANLVQLYTGWIFAGPALPHRIARALNR